MLKRVLEPRPPRVPSEPFILLGTDEPHLEKVPARMVEPLRLAHAGNGYAWIAGELNVPLGTVKSRISRARRQILRMRVVAAQGGQQLEATDA